MEQKKMNDNKVLRFIENQKKEKEAALNKILHLEEKLQAKQKLEVEIEELMKEVEGDVSQHLRQNGELRPTTDIIEDEIDATNQDLNKWQRKYDETSRALARLMEEKQRLELTHNEEIIKLQRASRECTNLILDESALMQRDLDSWRRDLDSWSKELNKHESLNELERRKLEEEKDKSWKRQEKASMEQKKADENVLRLIERQKRENEAALNMILRLENQLDPRQKLELEIKIEELKRNLQVMQHLGAADDQFLLEWMKEMDEDLKDKMDEIKNLKAMNQTLIVEERMCNDDLQETRKVLIEGLKEMSSARTGIIIKRMGELDQKPFHKACEEKFSAKEASLKAAALCSLWQENLRKPEWYPFKIVIEGGNVKEIINEQDELLISARNELGNEVCEAIITALKEINEFNPIGRYIVPEIWNSKENRKATLKEVVVYILKDVEILMSKKRKR